MEEPLDKAYSWRNSIAALFHRKTVIMLFLGFSAGIPILLIFSSLSIWLREAGLARSAVTYFSWAALGYSFKFVWAPLVDRVPLPLLTNALGKRRSWILLAQLGIIGAICLMAMTNPALGDEQLAFLAIAAVLLGFSSATQDIVIDAYRIEAAEGDLQRMMSATYISGYRIGMIVAGAGALYIADFFGTTSENYQYSAWKYTYLIMASCMLLGVITTLLIDEPTHALDPEDNFHQSDHLRLFLSFLLCVSGFIALFFFSSDVAKQIKEHMPTLFGSQHIFSFIIETVRLLTAALFAYIIANQLTRLGLVKSELIDLGYLRPVRSFIEDYGKNTALILLAIICLFRISDIVLGAISNVFYTDLGYTKSEIATAVKTFGLIMSIVGGLIGGVLTMRTGIMRMLSISAILVVITNLLFIILLNSGHNLTILYIVIGADNFIAGLASAAFVAFLSGLVNVKFTAMQYAILSSLMTLFPKLLAGYSGSIVDAIGYTNFFIFAGGTGIPVLFFIHKAQKQFTFKDTHVK